MLRWTLLLTVFFQSLTAQNDYQLPVTRAELFEVGATITRSGDLRLTKGEQELSITGLPIDIDPSTISIWMDKPCIILSQKLESNIIASSTQEPALQDSLRQLQDTAILMNELLAVIKGEEDILESNMSFLQSDQNFTPQEVTELRINYQTDRTGLAYRKIRHQIKLRELNEQIELIKRQIKEVGSQSKKIESQLVLRLQSDIAQTVRTELDYFHQQAGWEPTYDLRADATGQSLQIVYKANIYQNTKEDWDNVQLSLSTAAPNQNQTLPALQPYRLSFNNYYGRKSSRQLRKRMSPYPAGVGFGGRVYDEYGEPLIGANVSIQGTSIGTVTDIDGSFYFPPQPKEYSSIEISYVGFETKVQQIERNTVVILSDDAMILDEVVVTGYGGDADDMRSQSYTEHEEYIPPTSIVRSQTTISYDLDLPVSVHSTKERQTIMIRSELVDAKLAYEAIPKVARNAYLTATIKNWSQLQILPGVANIYISNRYLGQTYLSEPIDGDQAHTISLGQDREVYVERTLATDYKRTRWLGKNKIDTRKWNLNIVNRKNVPIDITIKDQYPISKSSDISIELKETSNAQIEKDLGKLEWKLNLPKETSLLKTFAYEVKYPKHKRLVVD